MATAEAIAIRQQLAAERIQQATGIQLPFVKGGAPIRLAAYLEIIADAVERGDIIINTKGSESHERANPESSSESDDEWAAESREHIEEHPRPQRKRGRQGG